ncbi:GntR family transcriptional regulator [uncultured Alsobacter sp.]|uniref:GntR family transcriptional regulator n=1 Tax=uncultured Alsobacter sp. TaxID=1748258 RepID=UPI0025F732A0|nr:GntR family transcriptional regulator [uncultured Alsobacter sp.]
MVGRSDEGEPLKLREKAYDAFKQRLLSREILPGQFVSQRELVEVTGLTLGAIRELVPRLEAEGLIRTVPQRGMQVAHIDLPLIRDAFQFRMIIEKEAMALFVSRASDAEMTRIQTAHTSIVERSRAGITPALLAEAQAVDWGLHDTIVDAMGNEIVSKAYRVNAIKIRLIRQQDIRIHDSIMDGVMEEHLRIVRAMVARDGQEAVRALEDHINHAWARAMGLEER